MKVGYIFWGSGWGLMLLGVIFIGLSIAFPEDAPSGVWGRIILCFILGIFWLTLGANKIQKARIEKLKRQTNENQTR